MSLPTKECLCAEDRAATSSNGVCPLLSFHFVHESVLEATGELSPTQFLREVAMSLPQFRVLLVEDNPEDAWLIRQWLSRAPNADFEMEVCTTLAGGIDRMVRGKIDVVLLDLTLPDSVGVETCRDILAEKPRAPVVVLTGLDDEQVGLESVRLGAQDYLVKGQVDEKLLGRALSFAIERHHSQAGRRRHQVDNDTNTTPYWDIQLRELRVGCVIVKRYRQPSYNQEIVLSAFQEESWPPRVDDPLPPDPELDPKTRLRSTIKSLNRNQHHQLLQFHGDGTGQAVLWELRLQGAG